MQHSLLNISYVAPLQETHPALSPLPQPLDRNGALGAGAGGLFLSLGSRAGSIMYPLAPGVSLRCDPVARRGEVAGWERVSRGEETLQITGYSS